MPPVSPSTQQITRRSRSNLAFALSCLPAERKRDMISFYAFCRIVDDVADDAGLQAAEKRRQLDIWRDLVLGRRTASPEDAPVVHEVLALPERYRFPASLLAEIIDGVASDIDRRRYETFADLLAYCYKVASVVGLVSIHIFGCRHPASHDYAINLGYALQLTNVLRDVGEDASTGGRIYLPLEDLRTHGVTETEILGGIDSPRMQTLLEFEYQRARHYYNLAADQMPELDRHSLLAAEMMAQIYSEILEKLRRNRFPVFSGRTRLHPLRKALILASYSLRGWMP